MSIIKVKNLKKIFNGREVLEGISFSVEKGEVFGFLGPNGAGKTTTVRCVLGLLHPDAGSVEVLGGDLGTDDPLRRRVGVLLESNGLSDRLTAQENLDYFARLYDLQNPEERVAEMLRFVGLEERKDNPVGTFSTGMKRKLGIARAVLNDPEVLFLDEPSSGLDPEAQLMVRDLILDLSKKEGMTVFLNSHNLDEVQRVCTSVAILHQGRIRAFDTVERLRGEEKGTHLEVVLGDPASAERASEILRGMPGITEVDRENESVTAILTDGSAAAAVRELVQAGCAVEEIRKVRRSLEQIYLEAVHQAEGST
ncbi:ABC transporter ATP-binding protein [Methanofollis aquaemaris]|uniref:ABC transporter ATP-binding protein n=1 Tax=Methanofollis aquaemaris TaxID=126734 RepID=A0A8A3S6M6_9EURY|nr:ABC transporter ATP-binding protein [Methanofollis aquaemaris]QSZ67256.1 ABC transporter ATP-binding protein [Methanofollis aquaemaris]